MGRHFIPTAVADLNSEWLTGVLRRSELLGTGSVVGFEVQPIGEGGGFMGETARLSLHYEGDRGSSPNTLIAKFPSTDRKVRARGETLGLYEREILLYQDLAQELGGEEGIRVPRCYFGEFDARKVRENGEEEIRRLVAALPSWMLLLMIWLSEFVARFSRRRYVLLLEDLAPARAGDQVSGCSRDELESVLRTSARLHGAYWESPELAGRFYVSRLDIIPRAQQMYYRQARPEITARYGNLMTERTLWRVDRVDEVISTLTYRFCDAPLTMVHGDLRLDNLFLSTTSRVESPGRATGVAVDPEVILIDWQVAAQGPGVYDIAYLLSSSLSAEEQCRSEADLLRVYHDELVRVGVRDYDYERLLRDYRVALLLLVHRVLTSIGSLHVDDERGIMLMDCWVERLCGRIAQMDDVEMDAALA